MLPTTNSLQLNFLQLVFFLVTSVFFALQVVSPKVNRSLFARPTNTTDSFMSYISISILLNRNYVRKNCQCKLSIQYKHNRCVISLSPRYSLAGHLRPVFARPVRQRRLESSHICEPSRLHLKFISFQRARCQPIMSSEQKRTGDSPKGVRCPDLTADL